MIYAMRIYRLPDPTTPEDLGCRWGKLLTFGDKVVITGYFFKKGNDHTGSARPFYRTAHPSGAETAVAAYAGVLTGHEEQLTSYEAQMDYHMGCIKSRRTGSSSMCIRKCYDQNVTSGFAGLSYATTSILKDHPVPKLSGCEHAFLRKRVGEVP